jgi:hypothetical protein
METGLAASSITVTIVIFIVTNCGARVASGYRRFAASNSLSGERLVDEMAVLRGEGCSLLRSPIGPPFK